MMRNCVLACSWGVLSSSTRRRAQSPIPISARKRSRETHEGSGEDRVLLRKTTIRCASQSSNQTAGQKQIFFIARVGPPCLFRRSEIHLTDGARRRKRTDLRRPSRRIQVLSKIRREDVEVGDGDLSIRAVIVIPLRKRLRSEER